MTWLKGLRFRFILPVILQVLSLSGISYISSHYLSKTESQIQDLAHVHIPKLENLDSMLTQSQASVRYTWSVYASGIDLEQRKLNKELAHQSLQKFETSFESFKNSKKITSSPESIRAIEDNWIKFKEALTKVLATLDKNEARWDEMAKYYMTSSVRSSSIPLSQSVEAVVADETLAIRDSSKSSEAEAKLARNYNLLVFIAAVILTTVIMILIANKAVRGLADSVTQLHSSGIEVQSLSQSVSNTSQDLNSGSTTTAASLEETVASLNMIMTLVQQNDLQLQTAKDLSTETRTSAQQGQANFTQLSSAMKEVLESSQKISEIIAVIDDIAFQTNLLALNASVEAARAGEHGKGFAVVADAVRSLAQRSATAAKDISTLINETQTRVERGNTIVQQSEVAFNQIVDKVNKVENLSNEIAQASKEQAESVKQINHALGSLDQSTQKNAQMAQELSEASENMNREAEEIARRIDLLQQQINGQKRQKDSQELESLQS